MDNEQLPKFEQHQQRLRGTEARLRELEDQTTKLDRLVYKLFKRLPRHAPEEESSPPGEAAWAASRPPRTGVLGGRPRRSRSTSAGKAKHLLFRRLCETKYWP